MGFAYCPIVCPTGTASRKMVPTLIVNHSHLDPNWRWLESSFGEPNYTWQHFSSFGQGWLSTDRPPVAWLARYLAAQQAVRAAELAERCVFVSHGPRPTFYASWISGLRGKRVRPHLAFSFNFTTLPEGRRRAKMAEAFRHVDRFVVYSQVERNLYADHFSIPHDKVDFLHFGVAPPRIDPSASLPVERPYVCAIGSQGRDYATLFEAARALPGVRIFVIAYQASLAGLTVPPNVTVMQGVPFDFAVRVAMNAEFMVLPLVSGSIPCGHVTAVTAMQVGCPMIATDSIGLRDYLRDGDTAVLVEPKRPDALIEAIRGGLADPDAMRASAARARTFAGLHCSEVTTTEYFRRVLAEFEADGRFSGQEIK